MKHYLIYVILVCLFLTNCKGIPKVPKVGAEQYCEELAFLAAKNDYSKADELTCNYLNNYDKEDLFVFLLELQRQFKISEKHHLGIFVANAESSKYPNMMELMRRLHRDTQQEM